MNTNFTGGVSVKKYYIEDSISYCFPYEISHKLSSDNYGVLTQYVEKEFNRDEIDKIICEMVTRHPYVEKSKVLKMVFARCSEMLRLFPNADEYKKLAKTTLLR